MSPACVLRNFTQPPLSLSTGSKITTLRGYDPDGDALTFGVRGVEGRELLRIEPNGATEANVYLRKPLDREVRRVSFVPLAYNPFINI